MARAYYSEIHLHFVWHTKLSPPLLVPEVEVEAHELVRQKALETRDVIVRAVAGTENHVHIAVTVPPTLTPATFVGQLKGSSSFSLNQIFPARDFAWQRGYGVVSYGTRAMDWVVAYILNQKQHHAEGTAEERLERIDQDDEAAEVVAGRAGAMLVLP